MDFMKHVRDSLPVLPCEAVVFLDQHQVHQSPVFRDYCRELGLEVILMPKFSCRLNPVERVWAMVKQIWAKRLSCTHHPLRAVDLEYYVQ